MPDTSPNTPTRTREEEAADAVAARLEGKHYVGERVRFNNSKASLVFTDLNGKYGTITKINGDGMQFCVRFEERVADKYGNLWFHHSWFK
jgi:hypothetical protein